MPQDERMPARIWQTEGLGEDELARLGNEKAYAELCKLREEIPKLRNDNKPLNRHAAAAVSLAAVVITGAQVYNTIVNSQNERERTEISQAEQRRRSETEQRIRCLETGTKVAEFAASQRDSFVNKEPKEQVSFMNIVLASFSPATARRVLVATASEARDSVVRARFEEALEQLRSDPATEACPAVNLTLRLPEPRSEQPVQPPPEPVPQTTGACPAVTAPASAAPLAIYPHVVLEADRPAVRKIVDRVRAQATDFTRVPIDMVEVRNPLSQAAEIRYYFREQEPQARRLAELLKSAACLEGITGLGDFRVNYIGDRYSNLPPGRIEVWFPAISRSTQP
ncbi:hypothetical protein [Roseomonas harenae]|uniref:hypothetical protein n=1 Tax=Muricoccus harenae TaxID=2692566 RepID=UPI001331AC66|nr:hypothetical protein [Roseomonas harenae]